MSTTAGRGPAPAGRRSTPEITALSSGVNHTVPASSAPSARLRSFTAGAHPPSPTSVAARTATSRRIARRQYPAARRVDKGRRACERLSAMQDEPTSLRIEDPGVRALFTEAARFQAWLDVEAALAEAQA